MTSPRERDLPAVGRGRRAPVLELAWSSTSGVRTIGVATFHRLAGDRTRISVTLDFQPEGLFEKADCGTRISRRALTSDLTRFKALVELRSVSPERAGR
jgi:uncharacterized membrane protein